MQFRRLAALLSVLVLVTGPGFAQTSPPPPPSQAAPQPKSGDAFGEEVTLARQRTRGDQVCHRKTAVVGFSNGI